MFSCTWLCNPMDCSPTGSSVHGTLQARILEWVAISFSRGSSRHIDQTSVSCVSWIGRWILYHCTTTPQGILQTASAPDGNPAIKSQFLSKNLWIWDSPGHPLVKTLCSQFQGAQVQSMVRPHLAAKKWKTNNSNSESRLPMISIGFWHHYPEEFGLWLPFSYNVYCEDGIKTDKNRVGVVPLNLFSWGMCWRLALFVLNICKYSGGKHQGQKFALWEKYSWHLFFIWWLLYIL